MDEIGVSELVRQAARRYPDRTAVVAEGRRLSFRELDRAVTRAALALLGTGAADGERVALRLATGLDFVLLYLGGLRAGLVVVPINPTNTAQESEFIVSDCGARLHLDAGSASALLGQAPDGADPQRDRLGEALAVLLYTSGTSGRAKGAMLSTRAMVANLDQLAAVEPRLLSDADVLLVPLPLTHVFGLNAGLGAALRFRATAVLVDRFDAGETLRLMAAERVSAVLGVPPQFAAWLGHPGLAAGFESVGLAMSGAAPLPPDIADAFAERGIVVHDGYGLTEASPVVSLTAVAGRGRPRRGSVGHPLPGVEVQLRDENGDRLDSDDDPGRLFVRGRNLFSGYWPDGAGGPEPDGWFGTGDVAVRDDDGGLHLVGRTTDLVIVNGFNVYPAEVETVLAAQPGVAEVAVVGVPDAQSGEAVLAYVVPAAGMTLDADALVAGAARSLARFKLPRTVEIVSALPHTVTGKVMKWRLLSGTDGDGSR